jgi:hypothetical protein
VDTALILDALYAGAAVVFLLLIVMSRRARRHGGAFTAGVAGAIYELQNRDKQKALDVIVEGRGAANEAEHAEGDLPQLESPKARGAKVERDL